MRVKAGKAKFEYLGTLIFLLLFFLKEAFPNAALAFTSLNACARSKECLELIKGSSSSAVSAPTGAGFGSSTLSTTTSSGTVRTLVKGVTDFAIVTAPTAAYVGWHYWNEAHNGRAQNRAREKYCAVYPSDQVCGGNGGITTIPNSYHALLPGTISQNGNTYTGRGINSSCQNNGSIYSTTVSNRQYWGKVHFPPGGASCIGYWVINRPSLIPDSYQALLPGTISQNGNTYTGRGINSSCQNNGGIYSTTVSNGQYWGKVHFPPGGANCIGYWIVSLPPWKDWPQAKRDAAVALLNNSDWQRLITSMPFGSALDPGDTAKAPTIVIPGQEWDNPNTPLDDRRLKTVPGEHARPVVPDFDHDSDPDETDADDDNDGVIEPYDPEPRNPYVPRASSEPPPPPDDDTPPQSEGEKAVSKVRQSYGDFLEKAENDTFENRLDTIEAKYKRAAAMEGEAAVDLNVGYEQDRLIAEADSERQQLEGELGEAWWSSLSQYEQQLFDGHPQAEIDEMQMHMKQWDQGTFVVGGVPQSVVYHAQEKGYTDYLEYLRDTSNFDKSQATRTPREGLREDYTVKWEIVNSGEYLIEDQNGKTLTYGSNE